MALDIKKPLSKRRFLQIVGISYTGLHSLLAFSKNELIKIKKNGRLLGTDAQITIFCDSKEKGELILDKCFEEVKKLELIFSLYKNNSVISLLNKYGEQHYKHLLGKNHNSECFIDELDCDFELVADDNVYEKIKEIIYIQ